jgi:tetratricopeptide (TPR) repeat protein
MSVDQQNNSVLRRLKRNIKTVPSDVRSFVREAPAAFVFAIGLILVPIIAYQPAVRIDRPWAYFQTLQRGALWLVRGTAFRSVAGPVFLMLVYGFLYYVFRVHGRRFIVVTEFRVWGELEKAIHVKGIAGRLQDELMYLLAEMEAPESGLPSEKARAGILGGGQAESRQPKPPMPGGLTLPETQVTLQYEGVSLEGLHTFIRRSTGREIVVTGDALQHSNGVLIVARTRDKGPWEVLSKGSDAVALREALQRLALRILTTLAQGFLPKEANTFVFLQFKAEELNEEYDLRIRLLELALNAAPRKQKLNARKNLAIGNYYRGKWHWKANRHSEADRDFERAIKVCDDPEVLTDLGNAIKELGAATEAEKAFDRARGSKAGKLESKRPAW